MAREGYLGGPIIRPGGTVPARVGGLTVARIPRQTGLAAHVAAVKRQAIVVDAAVIVARRRLWLTVQTQVALSPAAQQHFAASGTAHAAHAVKRFTFDGADIATVYARNGADEVALLGLRTMLGLVTDVDRRANLSIDKQLEGNPQRLAQLQAVVGATIADSAAACRLARELEVARRQFDLARLRAMRGGFGGDAAYAAMLAQYEAILGAAPPFDETPERMVAMLAGLAGG